MPAGKAASPRRDGAPNPRFREGRGVLDCDEVDYEESDDGDVPPGAVPDSDVLEGVPVDVAVPMNATLSVPSDEDDSLL